MNNGEWNALPNTENFRALLEQRRRHAERDLLGYAERSTDPHVTAAAERLKSITDCIAAMKARQTDKEGEG